MVGGWLVAGRLVGDSPLKLTVEGRLVGGSPLEVGGLVGGWWRVGWWVLAVC